MPTTLLSPSSHREASEQQGQRVINSRLYSTLRDHPHLTDISIDARCVMPPGYRLVRVDERLSVCGDAFELALLNDVESSVAYYSKVIIGYIPELFPQAITQCPVWRSPDARYAALVRDVAHNVLFTYLVERYDIIVSDNQVTGEGRFIWQRHVSRAIAYGLRVCYQAANQQLQPLPSQAELSILVDQIWSGADGDRDHLALISKGHWPVEQPDVLTERGSSRNRAEDFPH